MATVWFRVISHTNVPFNFGNGTVMSLPYGAFFEADPTLPDVRRYQTRFMPPKIVVCAAPTPDQDGAIIIKKPDPSYPLPSEQPPEMKKAQLPAGIHEVVKRTK